MIALDTNLLVYAHRSGVPEHRAARSAIARAAGDTRGFGVAVPAISEFWSVVTHRAASGRPSTPSEAAAFLEALVRDAGMRVWAPGESFGARLWKLAGRMGVRGPRIFDLQIALIAMEAGASDLWTHDRDFVTVPGLSRSDPLATVES